MSIVAFAKLDLQSQSKSRSSGLWCHEVLQ